MKNRLGDIIATITLKPTDQGGRVDGTPATSWNCLIEIDGVNFDVRFGLEEVGRIWPGQTVKVPVNFLYPDDAKRYCAVGKKFILKEIKEIGSGIIEELSF